MKAGAEWPGYACGDYLRSPLGQDGWWGEEGQYWHIEPSDRVHEDQERGFLIIGGPGVDGIRWGYRRGYEGVWAHYPIEDRFVFLAATALELKDGYRAGRIGV